MLQCSLNFCIIALNLVRQFLKKNNKNHNIQKTQIHIFIFAISLQLLLIFSDSIRMVLEVMKESKAMAQEILKIKILYPKTSKEFHQISEKYNEQKLFNKKAVLKSFAIFTGKHLCQSFFFKLNCRPSVCNFTKRRLQHRFSRANIAKFLRTFVKFLRNICEELLPIDSPFILV